MSAAELPRNTVVVGDARKLLAQLPERSVDTVITSPPYVQLRNYQVSGQIGLEPNVDAWVERLVSRCSPARSGAQAHGFAVPKPRRFV